MEHTRTLIIGAGVSGLGLADWLEGEDYLVVEAAGEIGGYCKTVERDGFVWDYSGHFFHFKHPEIERYLVDRMANQPDGKGEVRTVVKRSRIWFEGAEVDFPFQKNIHQLPRGDFIDCLVDLYFKDEVFGRGREPGAAPAHFKEMLYAKFGRGIAERFLVPYNEKLYATDLARLDTGAMGRFFPYASVSDIIRNFRRPDNASYNSTFTYPRGGAIRYVRALSEGVEDARIALGEPVVSIDLGRKVARTTRREIAFEYLVSSVPFVRLLDMTGLAYDPAVYSYNKVLVFNLGFDRKGPEGIHWMYYPGRDVVFYRVGFYDNIFGTPRMSLYVELGYPADATLSETAIAKIRGRVLADLAKVGVVRDHELVAEHSVVLDPAYVHITQASIADVEAKRRVLQARGVYSIGRYGGWTYCAIEDNLVEARALADVLNSVRAAGPANQ